MGACRSKPAVAEPVPPSSHGTGGPKHAAPPSEPLPAAIVDHHRETLGPVELTFLAGSALGAKVVEVLASGDALPEEDGTAGPAAALLFRMYDADRDGLLNDTELSAALHAFAVHAHAAAPNAGSADQPPTEEELAEVIASLKAQLVPDPQHPGAAGVTLPALTAWLEGFSAEGISGDSAPASPPGASPPPPGDGTASHATPALHEHLEGGATAHAPGDHPVPPADRDDASPLQQQQPQQPQELELPPPPVTPARRAMPRGSPGLPSLTPTSTAATMALPPPPPGREPPSSAGEDPAAATGGAGGGRPRLVPDGTAAVGGEGSAPGAAAAALWRGDAGSQHDQAFVGAPPAAAAYGGAVAAY